MTDLNLQNLGFLFRETVHKETIGPLKSGHYVQVGMGLGFYVPEVEYQRAQALADETRRVHFLAIDRDGNAILSARRDDLTGNDQLAGIAWIVPQKKTAR